MLRAKIPCNARLKCFKHIFDKKKQIQLVYTRGYGVGCSFLQMTFNARVLLLHYAYMSIHTLHPRPELKITVGHWPFSEQN